MGGLIYIYKYRHSFKKLNLLWSASIDLVVFEGFISWIYQHIDPKTSTWGAWL